MEVLWKEGEISAGQSVKILKEQTGWNRNTTYTVIKKCIDKGAIERIEPNYVCRPLISKAYVQQEESNELINKIFNGSIGDFFAAFVKGNKLSMEEVQRLKKLVEELNDK